MDKEIGKIKKNDDTEIIIRIDDFGGSMGLTIREYVNSDKYKGFTKAGVRIRSDKFDDFKTMINSVKTEDFGTPTSVKSSPMQKTFSSSPAKKFSSNDEASGIDDEGLM